MDEEQFRGFAEDDSLKSTVKNKLARINEAVIKLGGERIRTRTPSAGSSSSSGSRRPPNRFLKRSESLPSPSINLSSIRNGIAASSVQKQDRKQTVLESRVDDTKLMRSKRSNHTPSSCGPLVDPSISNGTAYALAKSSVNASTHPPSVSKVIGRAQNNTSPGSPLQRVNNFLKAAKIRTSDTPKKELGTVKMNDMGTPIRTSDAVKKEPDTVRMNDMGTPIRTSDAVKKEPDTVKVNEMGTPNRMPDALKKEPDTAKVNEMGTLNRTPDAVKKEPDTAKLYETGTPIRTPDELKKELGTVKVNEMKTPSPKNSTNGSTKETSVKSETEPSLQTKSEMTTEQVSETCVKSSKKVKVAKVIPLVETHSTATANCAQKKEEPVEESRVELIEKDKQIIPTGSKIEIISSHKPAPKVKKGQPTPTKRSASVSELSFLSGQTSRSKRTIVPNKRFFSEDTQPATVSSVRQEPSSQTPAKIVPTSRKSVPAISTSVKDKTILTQSKKRFVSGDGPKKRNVTIEASPIVSNVPLIKNTQVSVQPVTSDVAGRPRRTIIPNRKFISDDELPKDVKKTSENIEPQRKRRKSEKTAQNNPEKTELVEGKNNSILICDESRVVNSLEEKIETGAGNIVYAAKTELATVGKKPNVFSNSLPAPSNGDSAKANVTLKEPVNDIPEDELPLSDEEKKFTGNPLFLGSCILTAMNLMEFDSAKKYVNDGVLCCGICARLKKYRLVHKKRVRRSFLCTECIDIVNKIFQSALSSTPFSCVKGPPICVGACPLVFSPSDQFCQACFAKSCLKNLPMEGGIYFKIWRSIPPMARGCAPISPQENPGSPHIGSIVFVNECGEIDITTDSLEIFGPIDKSGDSSFEDPDASCLSNDLSSARLTTFPQRSDNTSANSCENAVPANNVQESLSVKEITYEKNIVKTNGAVKEEMLLGRQIGQERVTALVDPVLRPDAEDIETYGFPVVVSGSAYPRKPLCFLCGSGGINQLIFCSMCCEPYHPYCAGDDLLLDTYVMHYDNGNYENDVPATSMESKGCGNLDNSSCSDDASRIVLKWNCRRCVSCKTCGESIGRKELIRCKRCLGPFHMDTCIDKLILSKFKDRATLKKIWTCETCLSCKSCGKKFESNQRLRTIQQFAANSSDDPDEMEKSKSQSISDDNPISQSSTLMLCLECFKQRKKGSYCPLCEVCYDDDDWDSKMMECCKCNRWIHATCENLNDEQYQMMGLLPEYIEFICRLCRSSGTPLWYDAIQSQLIKGCNSALRLFEKKAVREPMRKRSSVDVKPSFVCNLFGSSNQGSHEAVLQDDSYFTPKKSDTPKQIKRLRPKFRRVTYKEILNCKVKLRDFVKYPKTAEENWYALKILEVEILKDNYIQEDVEKVQLTPIHKTPTKVFTPKSRVVSSITNTLKEVIGSVKTLRAFQKIMLKEVNSFCETEEERVFLARQANEAINETFPWFESLESTTDDELSLLNDTTDEICQDLDLSLTNSTKEDKFVDPFKEVYWDLNDFFDDRICALCGEVGDFPPDKCGRLLWCGVNEWIHCNCAIWSSEVYELDTGALQQVGGALNRGKMLKCKVCRKRGATVSCCHSLCKNSYHFLCAIQANCFLLEDKTMFCSHHNLSDVQRENIQDVMKIGRKVFVDLDWIQKRGSRANSDHIKVFIGSMKIDSLGCIVPISVSQKDKENPSETILIPKNFCAQRLFWSLDNPCEKENYVFETGISFNSYHKKTQDAGVNLVVNHESVGRIVQNGLDNISKFHEWLKVAPRYIDEEFVEWLTPCPEEFIEEHDELETDPNLFAALQVQCNKGRISPCSTSSFSSSIQSSSSSNDSSRRTYHFRSLPGRIVLPKKDNEELPNISNAHSLGDTLASIRESSPSKRRRNSWRSGPPSRKKQISSKKSYESPRRRSMRNLYRKEVATFEGKSNSAVEDESDNDSGVIDAVSSTTGSYDDGEKVRCRVSLLARFNETFEKDGTDYLNRESPVDEAFVSDAMSISSSNFASQMESFEPNMDYSSAEKLDHDGKVYHASIKIEVKRHNLAICYQSCDIKSAWMFLFEQMSKIRIENRMIPLAHPALDKTLNDDFAESENCYRMLGLNHRSVQFLIEQLPGVVKVADRHSFRYAQRPYVDLSSFDCPLASNSTGSARSEGFKGRKPFDMFGWLASRHRNVTMSCRMVEEPIRNLGLPLAMRYRDLGERAKKRFVVSHSEIHGRGLFARCDVEKGDMVIEYAGEVIRPSLSDPRERYYESRGIGCYMFRIKTQVIDATLKGNAARFINHSCEPNCEAKTHRILGKDHIIIFALRKIFRGEELTYDYKFEREEDKIPCTCGAARCRRYMN